MRSSWNGRGTAKKASTPAWTVIARTGCGACWRARCAWSTCRSWRSLQNGTAFFASTSLLAIGGALTLLRSTEELMPVVSALPFGLQASRELWEAKTMGLVVVFAYAFFKFGWAYRLYNYVAILLGAMPFAADKATPEAEAHVIKTARLFEAAGRHFNRGQRAFFFAIGYLGWFAGPVVLMVTTVAVVVAMWRRQFASDALRAVMAK